MMVGLIGSALVMTLGLGTILLIEEKRQRELESEGGL